jgi:hypothetical protein
LSIQQPALENRIQSFQFIRSGKIITKAPDKNGAFVFLGAEISFFSGTQQLRILITADQRQPPLHPVQNRQRKYSAGQAPRIGYDDNTQLNGLS